MTDAPEDDLIARIDAVLAAGTLPDPGRRQGMRLRQRLSQPVRVAVAGPAQTGKSSLIALLAGWDADAGPVANAPPAGIPSDLFDRMLLLECPLAPDETLPCGAGMPDIVLWTSQSFEAPESAAWARVPESLKDHSFLVLTKADLLIREGVLYDRLDRLRQLVGVDFHALFPLATTEALAADRGRAPCMPAEHGPSGAKALFAALERMVRQGFDADRDLAETFLHRYGSHGRFSGPGPRRGHPGAGAPMPSPGPKPPSPSAPPDAVQKRLRPRAGADDRNLCERGLAVLAQATSTLPERVDRDDAVAGVLGICADTALSLADLLGEVRDVCPDLDEDILDASEMLQLLAVEDDPAAAADAVTLLLQLRRGFETRLSA
ncbi:hypothetical protein BYZ73_02095 [Rhodovulum viride]|uniref:50S ribosome-binding GTPase n=1 Tax=Rhodovulum viride TaxID=1231134 RepID=A0ABX9DKR4_9RHOB|nr:hypothetical protein [Rhodovulum viride]RAP42992.1 hypothetical protein BYZ73_02095 [Rhodovulum viride]